MPRYRRRTLASVGAAAEVLDGVVDGVAEVFPSGQWGVGVDADQFETLLEEVAVGREVLAGSQREHFSAERYCLEYVSTYLVRSATGLFLAIAAIHFLIQSALRPWFLLTALA